MPNIKDHSAIVNQVVFVRLSFGVLGNSKQVKEDILTTDADRAFLKVNKELLESPELKAIIKADANLRGWLKDRCLPYDTGFMLLPKGMVDSVAPVLSDYQEVIRPDLVKKFLEAYPLRCEEATQSLGSLHKASEYPSIEEVKEKFYFDYQYLTFATPDAEKFQGIAAKADEQFKARLEEASISITILMRETLLGLVDHLKIALEPSKDGKKKRVFASSITNIQDFLDTFKARNITQDSDLEAIVADLENMIHPGFDVDVLKQDESFKTDFHGKLSEITSNLKEIVEVKPGRKFKFSEEEATV